MPADVLLLKTLEAKTIDEEIRRIATDLQETLWAGRDKGIGLAAPQIGYSKRLFVAHRIVKRDQDPIKYLFINPEIKKASSSTEIGWEGCLSIPDTYCKIQRSKEVVVEYLDLNGIKQKTKASGFFARVIQHEIDHLDGILITQKCIGEPLTEKQLDEFLAKEGQKNA